jgi:CPA2 family monovalent cation:H+ antiporter-2
MSTAAPPAAAPIDDRVPTTLRGHVVLIGYGRVGSVVAEGLGRQNQPFVVIEDSEKRIAAAHAAGVEVVVGNAASGKALGLANVGAARALLVAIPNAFEAGQAVEQAHKLNPDLQIVARAHADEEIDYLRDLGATQVIMGEREIGLGMLGWIEAAWPAQPAAQMPASVVAEAPIRAEPVPVVTTAPAAAEPRTSPAEPQAVEAGGALIELPPAPKTPPRPRPAAPASQPAVPFTPASREPG